MDRTDTELCLMWWFPEVEERDVGPAVVHRADEIRSAMNERYERIKEYYMMYGDAYGIAHGRVPLYRTLRNTLAEAIDAKCAELNQDCPRVVITMRDESWTSLEQGRYWGWYEDAAHSEQRFPLKTFQCTRDSGIAGTGFCVVLDEDTGPVLTRVHPLDVFIDDAGCMDIDPPEVIVRWRQPRHWLARKHPHLRDQILYEAPSATDVQGRDVLEVFEAWYEGTDDEPGRHVRAIRGIEECLLDKEWIGRPPIAYLVTNPATQGVWGESWVERSAPAQNERSLLSDKIQEGIYWTVPKLFAMNGTIPEGALDNAPGPGPVECTRDPGGPALREVNMSAAGAEVYLREEKLDQYIFDSMGSSRQFATGEQPNTEESGRKLRMKYVIRNRQLKLPASQIQLFVEQCMYELVRGEQRCYERDNDYEVTVRVDGVTKNLAATMFELDVNSLQIRAKSASSLGLDAAEEFAELERQFKEGLFDLHEFHWRASRLDLDGVTDLATSHVAAIHRQLDAIVWDGKPSYPPRYIDVARAMKMGVQRLMKAENNKCPPKRLQMLREWIDLVKQEQDLQLKEAAEQQAALAPPPAPMMPRGGNGMAPPPDMGGPPPVPGAPPPLDQPPSGGVVLQ